MAKIPHPSGTPETERKKASDIVLDLFRRGQLERRHVLAAECIRDIVYALGGAMLASQRYEPREYDIPRKYGGRALLERMPERLYRQWKVIYGPWERALSTPVIARRPLTLARLVLSIVIDNTSPAHAKAGFGIPRGFNVAKQLSASLELYSKMAKLK